MRQVSLSARTQHDQAHSGSVEIVLLKFSHVDLITPIRLSTDPSELLSADPLAYGTRSTWLSGGDTPFQFVIASALLPDDIDEVTTTASIVIEAAGQEAVDLLRSVSERATVDMAMVLADTPDLVEAEWRGLELVGMDGDASAITLKISGDDLYAEPWPTARMTKNRFPGLFK
jgi:hypothetical protein